MDVFSKQFEVDYIAAKPNLNTSFARLMEYVQEGSTAHTESTRYPMAWFAEQQTGWVITNWRAVFYAYPKYGATIRVTTWPAKFKGILADRCFAVYDQNGAPLLDAVSSWIYTDLKQRKPIRPFPEMIEGYGEPLPAKIDKNYTMPPLAGCRLMDEQSFIVRRRDIDTNFHVNNIKYLEWAQDGVPEAVYYNADVAEMRANYKKECALGQQVCVQTFAVRENEGVFVSIIKRKEPDGTDSLLAEVYTKWV